MASASQPDEETASNSDSVDSVSDSDGNSDVDSDDQSSVREPCKFYNKNGRCRDGNKCSYWHVCKYALSGNCLYGSSCKLNHPRDTSNEAPARSTSRDDEEEQDLKLTDGRLYQWQLNDGNEWMDISNDHVIEAQYSLPHTKSIKIYNTPYGAVSIDFNKMRVYKKSLRVRRLDDGNTEWVWYCTLRRKWNKYGDKNWQRLLGYDTTFNEPDEETASNSDSVDSVSDSDGNSDVDSDDQSSVREPCKFYNKNGRCRDGNKCSYWHVCKYALSGNCLYGSSCKLNHPRDTSNEAPARSTSRDDEEEQDLKLTDGRLYQWQLNDGNEWMDISNDHVIEAQYSLPHTKSIKIYNTPYGAVSIDFNKMRVYKKSLRVRRLDDGNTEWVWYCTLRRKWNKYGDKDSKGNTSPVKSADIEKKYQSNPTSSFTFTVGTETLEIRFREMRQVGKNRKRKVTRRPLYRQQQASAQVSQAAAAIQNVSLGSKPQWQFEGDSGAWHIFKHRSGTRTECSLTSEDIERKYQQNPGGSMTFKVNRQTYKLDFNAMTQTNQKTTRSRKIRRVLV